MLAQRSDLRQGPKPDPRTHLRRRSLPGRWSDREFPRPMEARSGARNQRQRWGRPRMNYMDGRDPGTTLGSLEPGVSTGGLLTNSIQLLHGVSPQTPQMSTVKSIGGNGFERIGKSKWGRFRQIGKGLPVREWGAELELRTLGCKPGASSRRVSSCTLAPKLAALLTRCLILLAVTKKP